MSEQDWYDEYVDKAEELTAALARVARLEAALRRAYDMLKPVQGETCPQCAALLMDHDDHARGCGLAAVLEQIDSALEAQP